VDDEGDLMGGEMMLEEEGGIIYPAHSKRKTFTRFMEVEAWRHSDLTDIQPVMKGIQDACRGIARLVRRAQIDEISG